MMKSHNTLLKIIISAVFIVAFIMIINVILVAVFKVHARSMTSLTAYVDSVSYIKETEYASRGNIYDANGMTIAQDQSTYNVICYLSKSRTNSDGSAAYVEDKEYTARVLASILEADEATIYDILVSAEGKYQTEIGTAGRQIDEDTKLRIEEYDLPGVEFIASSKRYYPLGEYFSPYLVGFAQEESGKLEGKMGVEQYLNDELSGIDGYRIYQADRDGYVLEGMSEEVLEAIDGYDVYLTLDNVIQDALETALESTIENKGASKAWGAVVEIKSGKILAWGQIPSFNNNNLDIDDYNNYGSQLLYEPGSVFKVFAYAAAIDSGNYDGSTLVDSSNFCYVSSGGNPIRTYSDNNYGCITNSEYKTYGMVEYDYGLIMSLNTVTSSIITDLISPELYLEYLYKFGFFNAVNSDGILENVGYIQYSQPVEKLTATYGHGLTVNMLELLQAYTAIFGNGEMVKPYYIDKIYDPLSDTVIYEGQREVVDTVISEDSAKELQDILRRVVSDERGTARYYEVEGLDIMAKTGTSQVLDENGLYAEGGEVISSVMLAFPYEDPEYMVYYAYQAGYDRNSHYNTEEIKELVNKIAIITNLKNTSSETNVVTHEIAKVQMPSVKGHSLEYATNKLNNLEVEVIVLGDGTNIVDQYPKAGSSVYSGSKVYLLTDSDTYIMPDLTGWSRKEVSELWNISGIAFTLDGYGIVSSQSIVAGEIINKNSLIEVSFSSLANPNSSDLENSEEMIE